MKQFILAITILLASCAGPSREYSKVIPLKAHLDIYLKSQLEIEQETLNALQKLDTGTITNTFVIMTKARILEIKRQMTVIRNPQK